uniref:Uncharacterized protein n=1 Tax=Rhizophora mucronata TaxID=61149 RepID=A0A2P2NN43_RHIMU
MLIQSKMKQKRNQEKKKAKVKNL